MSVPVMETRKGYQQQIRYVPISIGYAMWTPEKSKLELATELLGEIMLMLKDKQVILMQKLLLLTAIQLLMSVAMLMQKLLV